MKKEIEFKVELRWYSIFKENPNARMIDKMTKLDSYDFKAYSYDKEEFKNWLINIQNEMNKKYGAYYKDNEKVCFFSTIHTTPYLNMENGSERINLYYKGCMTPILVGDYGSIEDLFKQIDYLEEVYNMAKKLAENM